MQAPTSLTMTIGIAVGAVVTYVLLWHGGAFGFANVECRDGDASQDCSRINFRAAVYPSLITVGGCTLLVWVGPFFVHTLANLSQSLSGTRDGAIST